MSHRILIRSALAVSVCTLLPQHVYAESDFTDMSLEELMEVDVKSVDVLGIHTHKASELMLSYRVMFMNMSGLREGTVDIRSSNVLADYMVTPTDMRKQTHMFGLMTAPTDKLTVGIMVPYHRISMDHLTRAGGSFTTKADGIGDITIALHRTVFQRDQDRHRIIVSGIAGLPTGSIHPTDDTPAGSDQVLPYPMRLSTGTFDAFPKLSYHFRGEAWAISAQTGATIRLNENPHKYKLGNGVEASGSISRSFRGKVATLMRISASQLGKIRGGDSHLNAGMVSTADPDNQGGWHISGAAGASFLLESELLGHTHFAVEATLPLVQSFHGPQLKRRWSISAGLQWIR